MAARPDIKRGYGSDERPLAGVLWQRDAHDATAPALTAQGDYEPDFREVDYRRYWDPQWAAAEVEHVWKKSWLLACREEDIPQVGDRVPLHVGELSYIIVRTAEDSFKAFHNSCLHRGTMLCTKHESGESIRCPYHAWEWNIDGRLKKIPSHWDFTGVTRLNGSLPEIKLERWGGFIFVNADPDSGSLMDALGPIPDHFAAFAPERRYTASRFRKTVKANWKVSQEAFQEAYHLFATHPEAMGFNGDSQTQYDIWLTKGGHVGRNAGCSATPSMHAPSEATVFAAGEMFLQAMKQWHYPDAEIPPLDPEQDVRTQLGEWHRDQLDRHFGRSFDLPDAIVMDSLLYFFYPHSCFWLSESVPFVYQFLPHETDPEMSYFDVRLMRPLPEGQPVPPSAPVIEIGPDEKVFDMAPAFGFLAYVFDQDMSNMPLIQRGMHAANPKAFHSRLGAYQEMIIQHWNDVIEKAVSAG